MFFFGGTRGNLKPLVTRSSKPWRVLNPEEMAIVLDVGGIAQAGFGFHCLPYLHHRRRAGALFRWSWDSSWTGEA